MKHALTLAMTIAGLLGPAASAQQNSANRMTQEADNSFATKAAQGGIAEVELGKLATERATNDSVKRFAQQMVDDHTKANDELKTLAAGKGMNLPTTMDSKSQATANRLSKLQGAAFDRAYMADMVSDHKKDVAEFQKEADSGSDSDMKAFASKTLPTLRQHLKMAEDAYAAAKK